MGRRATAGRGMRRRPSRRPPPRIDPLWAPPARLAGTPSAPVVVARAWETGCDLSPLRPLPLLSPWPLSRLTSLSPPSHTTPHPTPPHPTPPHTTRPRHRLILSAGGCHVGDDGSLHRATVNASAVIVAVCVGFATVGGLIAYQVTALPPLPHRAPSRRSTHASLQYSQPHASRTVMHTNHALTPCYLLSAPSSCDCKHPPPSFRPSVPSASASAAAEAAGGDGRRAIAQPERLPRRGQRRRRLRLPPLGTPPI